MRFKIRIRDMNIDKNEFRRGLEQAIEEETGFRLDEPNEVPFTELFPEEFMQLYTEFTSIEAFFDAGPWEMNDELDSEAIPEEDLDKHVDVSTDFPEWQIMLDTAAQRLIERRSQ